jgi:endonuclease/exonuclease/phosphatase (EEP) superfamily protein YafD
LGQWGWFLDLFAHFRGQYAVALAASAVLMAVARRPWAAGLFTVGAAANAIALAPLFLPDPGLAIAAAPSNGTTTGRQLRITTCNLLYTNPDRGPTLAWLRSHPADILFLCEVTPAWTDALRSLRDIYPHQEHRPQQDPFGCSLLSRTPWTHMEEKQFGPFASPSLAARFSWHGKDLLVVGMHPPPPNSGAAAAYRDAALSEAAEFLSGHAAPSRILLGDLNTTPWSHAFLGLTARAGLTDTAHGHGWQPTWNVGSWLFQIPIDHVLSTPNLVATERLIGPDLGSDHRAVIVTLSLSTRAGGGNEASRATARTW